MKLQNNLFLPAFFCIIFLFNRCTRQPDAEETALSFFNTLYNDHNLDKAEKMVTEASISRLENDFKFIDGALQIVKDNQPVHYEYVVDEKSTIIKNDSAFVSVKTVSDGSAIKVLLLQENAEWKIDLTWDENNMNAATKEVTDQVLRIMKEKVR